MFDAVDTGPVAGPVGTVPNGVRCDAHACPVSLVGDRSEFLIGVLLGTGGGAVRHHATRRGDLDQLGAVANLIPHARPYIVDTVRAFPWDGDSAAVTISA